MSPKKSPRKKRAGVEWVGGVVSMPAYVTGEGEPYRPDALFWLTARGAVLSHTVGRPGELVGLACESLRGAIESPLAGQPHTPDRVRVASPELAAELRAGQSAVEVVCAPTPELGTLFQAMRAALVADAQTGQSFLPPGVGPGAIASLFGAAAAVYRAAPWATVPSDESLVSISIEALGVSDAVLSVIGQDGESPGLVLFASVGDFEAYLDAADAMEHGEDEKVPRHFVLTFEPAASLGATARQEVLRHQWEVASADAYPILAAADEDLIVRPPTGHEVTVFAAIARALAEVLEADAALVAAWRDDEPFARTVGVVTHAGPVQVSLRGPVARTPFEVRPSNDLLGRLLDLGWYGDELDAAARKPLEDELVRQFSCSPEASAVTGIQSYRLVMDFAANHFDATIATLAPRELSEIVFDIIPRKVMVGPSEARTIIEELRALYAFLGREFRFEQAETCLRVLGRDAVKKLEAALSARGKFSMAKSLLVGGLEAGFDTESTEGLEASLGAAPPRPAPASGRPPSPRSAPRPPGKAAARTKKTTRKTTRKTRKKSP